MANAAVSSKTLLIVDEDLAQLMTLCEIFTDKGFEVSVCSTFQEALERC